MQLEELPTSKTLTISHQTGTFQMKDDAAHSWHDETNFSAIVIGGVKQRMMWPTYSTTREGSRRPLCKSSDNKVGYPQADFPWGDERAVPGPHTAITCEQCKFRLDPRKNKLEGHPVCESSYKLILLDADSNVVIFNAMGAAKRVVAHYAQWFKNNQAPMFTYTTRFELNSVKNNGRRWADLEVNKVSQTDRTLWVTKYLPLFKQWKEELEVPPLAQIAASARPELPVLDM